MPAVLNKHHITFRSNYMHPIWTPVLNPVICPDSQQCCDCLTILKNQIDTKKICWSENILQGPYPCLAPTTAIFQQENQSANGATCKPGEAIKPS